MERLPNSWIKMQNQHHMPLSRLMIIKKAQKLFEDLKQRVGACALSEHLNASPGWFTKFKVRDRMHYINITSKAASADVEAADTFCEHLQRIIEESGCRAKQGFNVDETGLF